MHKGPESNPRSCQSGSGGRRVPAKDCFWRPGVGREGGAGAPPLDGDVWAVAVPGRLPGSGWGTTKLPSGKSPCHCLAPLPSAPGESHFPTRVLGKKMNRVVKQRICIRLQESLGVCKGQNSRRQLAELLGTLPRIGALLP